MLRTLAYSDRRALKRLYPYPLYVLSLTLKMLAHNLPAYQISNKAEFLRDFHFFDHYVYLNLIFSVCVIVIVFDVEMPVQCCR